MSELHLRAKLRAVAYQAAADLGHNRAIELLQEVAKELKDDQWREPGRRG